MQTPIITKHAHKPVSVFRLSVTLLPHQTCQIKPDRSAGFAVGELDHHFGVSRGGGET